MDDFLSDFVAEALDSLDQVDADLTRFAREPANDALLERARAALHTIKGNCGLLALPQIGLAAHRVETALAGVKGGDLRPALAAFDRLRDDIAALGRSADPSGAQTRVRVPVERLDRLLDEARELVLVRNLLAEVARARGMASLRTPLQRLGQVTGALSEMIERAAMQPVGAAWRQARRMLRDIGGDLGKEFVFEEAGGDIEIDRRSVDVLRECLVHLIRNAAVHGVETPAERLAGGKPAEGRIRVMARRAGARLHLRVSDDGRGLACPGIPGPEAARLETLIFEPGFTTAAGVTQWAGRGVGLGIVRRMVGDCGGSVAIETPAGGGFAVELTLMLEASIVQTLIVAAGGQKFAIAQRALGEVLRHPASAPVVVSRGLELPIIDLARHFRLPAGGEPKGLALACESDGRRFALGVARVIGPAALVVAPTPQTLAAPWYAGAAILGDGEPVLLLEPSAFADVASVAAGAGDRPAAAAEPDLSRFSPDEVAMIAAAQAPDPASAAGASAGEPGLMELRVGARRFALPVDQVSDVFDLGGLKCAPLTPRHVLGLVHHRGRTLWVLSLASLLGLEPDRGARGAFATAVALRGSALALQIDAAEVVLEGAAASALDRLDVSTLLQTMRSDQGTEHEIRTGGRRFQRDPQGEPADPRRSGLRGAGGQGRQVGL